MSFGDRMAPFNAVDGLGFWSGHTPFSLAAGRYPSGEGAIQVMAVDGQPECKLTVSIMNLDGAKPLEVGEIWVKLGVDGEDTFTRGIRRSLIRLGVFDAVDDFVKQGFVERYAQRWRFARCRKETHLEKEIAYVVECRECRDVLRRDYEDGKTRLLAKDAVKRIRSMGGNFG